MLTRMCQRGAIPENAFDQTLEQATALTQQFPSERMFCSEQGKFPSEHMFSSKQGKISSEHMLVVSKASLSSTYIDRKCMSMLSLFIHMCLFF